MYYYSYAYDFYVYRVQNRVRLDHRKHDRRLTPHDAAPCGSGALDLPSRLLSRTGTSPLQLHALTPVGWYGARIVAAPVSRAPADESLPLLTGT